MKYTILAIAASVCATAEKRPEQGYERIQYTEKTPCRKGETRIFIRGRQGRCATGGLSGRKETRIEAPGGSCLRAAGGAGRVGVAEGKSSGKGTE